MQAILLAVLTLGRVSAFWAGVVTPGDLMCQGMVFLQVVGHARLQPGKAMSSCEHWGFSVSAPAKRRDHSNCHTLEYKVYMCHMVQRFSLCAQKQTLEKERSWPGFEDEPWINVVFGTGHPVLSSMTCTSGWLFWVMAARDLLERGWVVLHENQAPLQGVAGRESWNKRPKLSHHFWS